MKTNADEAARILGIKTYVLLSKAERREVPCRRRGGELVFDLEEIQAFRRITDHVSLAKARDRLRGRPEHVATAPEPEPVVDAPKPSVLERVSGWLS